MTTTLAPSPPDRDYPDKDRLRKLGRRFRRRVAANTAVWRIDADKAERIRNLLLPTQSIQYAHDRARQLVDKALGAIADLPESEAKSVLQTMARFVIARPM